MTAVTAVAVVLSYLFVDRPFARFSHDVLRPHEFLAWTTGFNRFLQPAAIVALAAVGVYGLLGRRFTNGQTFVLLACTVYLVTRGFKDDLQWAFGRTWPEPWLDGNPSYIGDGSYYFDPFNGAEAHQAFPSGTAASIAAAFSVAWFWYPRLRWLYAVPIAAVVVALLASDFHWLSDVIAGLYLGFAIGWVAVVIWRTQTGPAVPDDAGSDP